MAARQRLRPLKPFSKAKGIKELRCFPEWMLGWGPGKPNTPALLSTHLPHSLPHEPHTNLRLSTSGLQFSDEKLKLRSLNQLIQGNPTGKWPRKDSNQKVTHLEPLLFLLGPLWGKGKEDLDQAQCRHSLVA